MESEDDSEETLGMMRRWEIPTNPPRNVVNSVFVGKCSRPIRKQLTESDVNGEHLMLASMSQVEKKFLPLLEESEIPRGKEVARVLLYGPDGKVHDSEVWIEDSPNLTTGWKKFVGDYELKEICDFVTVWMFRHRFTHQICFGIDCKRLALQKLLSKRISEAVFDH